MKTLYGAAGIGSERGNADRTRVYHVDHGYEGIVEKLQGVGAAIERVHGSGT